MAHKTEQYYPSLFNRPEEEQQEAEGGQVIPQNTLYDMPLQSQHTPCQKHITVFGFSPQNRQNVLAQIRKIVTIERKEEGKNYINVWAEDPSQLDNLLKFNYKTINGELIGVFRKNFGVVQDGDIYAKKKGLFRIIKEYFLGEE